MVATTHQVIMGPSASGIGVSVATGSQVTFIVQDGGRRDRRLKGTCIGMYQDKQRKDHIMVIFERQSSGVRMNITYNCHTRSGTLRRYAEEAAEA